MERLRAIRERSGAAGIFLDFDGTLSEIAPRPDLARPLPDAAEVLSALAARFALVAVVTGRPSPAIRERLLVASIRVFGLYGLEPTEVRVAPVRAVRADVDRAAAAVPGAWVEDKGPSLAVHYRGARDEREAERELAERLAPLAVRQGLELLKGKKVLELAPAETPGKGAVVREQVLAHGLQACLYAGDDISDIEAFSALAALRTEGLEALGVAVRSAETPAAVLAAADVAVDGPPGLLALLRGLLDRA